jgi:superfamily II DNA/RNA helicase
VQSLLLLLLLLLQAACIPLALAGRDICGSAMTGSGKTAAFALTLLYAIPAAALHRLPVSLWPLLAVTSAAAP